MGGGHMFIALVCVLGHLSHSQGLPSKQELEHLRSQLDGSLARKTHLDSSLHLDHRIAEQRGCDYQVFHCV